MTTVLFPPGPKHNPWRQLLAYRRDPMGFLMRMARDHGDLVHFQMGPTHICLLNHHSDIKDVLVTHHRNFVKTPGLLQRRRRRVLRRATWLKLLLGEGLLTSEGTAHRRQRRNLQPAFHPHRIATYGAIMTDYAVRMLERWQDGEALDIGREMRRLTLSIVGKTLFGADVESEAEEMSEAFATILELQGRITMPLAVVLQKFPLPATRSFRRALDRVHAIIARSIEERQASGHDPGDLLSIILHAQHDEDGEAGLTDAQVWDHMRTFFLTGYFTTANALTWTWYVLSQHPDVEAKLHAELDLVLAGRLATMDDLKHLPYTEMVFSEVLRLYPPIWIMSRWVLNDYEIGHYVLPAKSLVLISQYVAHHSPRYFPDPFRFDPQRWTPEAKAERPMFAYFPFGGGPRQCVGEGFAWMEAMLIVATLAQRWQMRLVPGHPVDIEPQASSTLRPKYGMRMTLKRRGSLGGSEPLG